MRSRWKNFWVGAAQHVASLSKDPSTQVGCVVVSKDGKRQLGMGFNGFPPQIKDSPSWLEDRPKKYALTIHAEMNALFNAYQNGHYDLAGCHLFTTLVPCHECAKHIVASGINKVYFPTKTRPDTMYGNLQPETQVLFAQANVVMEHV